MFKEYDHVKIKDNNVTGIIVDISYGDNVCLIESDDEFIPDDNGDNTERFAFFSRSFDEIEKI